MYKVVAFYTVGTPYEAEIKKLQESLGYWGLDNTLYPVENKGDWKLNCGQKPIVLKQALEENDADILYLDADAVVKKFPSFFNGFAGDLGIHFKDGKELLSGTIYLRNNTMTRRLVDKWCQAQAARPGVLDQRVLADVLAQFRVDNPDYSVTILPPQYCQIFDTMSHHGEAVIEHNQASRRFKAIIRQQAAVSTVPEVICGLRTRSHSDGSFTLPRISKAIEAKLDAKYIKYPNEYRWYPRHTFGHRVKELAPRFKGKTAYIVGKGPSLDDVIADDFEEGCPIVCLNESIKKIEQIVPQHELFVLQQDDSLGDSCYSPLAALMIAASAAHGYSQYPNLYVYYPEIYGLTTHTLSMVCAIRILRQFGIADFRMICFDAATVKNTEYAKIIGVDASLHGNPKRFLAHRLRADYEAGQTPLEWISPVVR